MVKKIMVLFLLCSVNRLYAQLPIDSIITAASLKENVTALAHDSMRGRLTATTQLLRAASYLEKQFENAGLKKVSGFNDLFWRYHFTGKNGGKSGLAVNVVGALPGDSAKVVIFTAHYDHIGTTSFGIYRGASPGSRDDSIYNGANDNATGVAALLELAKYYAARKTNKYALVFIAFSGEEAGLVGSATYVEAIDPKYVVKVINLEMLGRPSSGSAEGAFLAGNDFYHIRRQMNRNLYAADKTFGKRYFRSDSYPEEFLDRRSDSYSFLKKGVDAFTIMATSPKDIFYHTVDDETETINFSFLHRNVKAIALACEPFLSE
jgi:Zn-dependent M28 family amino/carboxypeptidase